MPAETIEDLLTSNTQEVKLRREACANTLHNLVAALGDLANALRAAGRLEEALSTSEQAVDIPRALGHDRNAAAGLVRTARILMELGRYQEAGCPPRAGPGSRPASRRSGSRGNNPSVSRQPADDRQQYDRAVDLYKQALRLFQDANDDASIMRTCNQLGAVETSRAVFHKPGIGMNVPARSPGAGATLRPLGPPGTTSACLPPGGRSGPAARGRGDRAAAICRGRAFPAREPKDEDRPARQAGRG